MHNPRHTKPTLLLTGLGLLVCLLLSLGSEKVLADDNVTCQGAGTNGTPEVIDLGDLQPGQQFQRDISAKCVTLKVFPSGVSIGQFQSNNQGGMTDLTVILNGSLKTIPLQSQGTAGPVCLPSGCFGLGVYADMSYSAIVVGQAKSTYGSYSIKLYLHYTMLGAVTNNGQLQEFTFKYTVGKPGCTMLSESYHNLAFGTLNSNDFATSQQIANIVLDCPGNSNVTATLSSGQATTGAAGVSKTSLPELLMVATWADSNTPVNFGTPRTIGLSTGINAIRLGFRPRLVSPNSTPIGKFLTQYTLNLTYP